MCGFQERLHRFFVTGIKKLSIIFEIAQRFLKKYFHLPRSFGQRCPKNHLRSIGEEAFLIISGKTGSLVDLLRLEIADIVPQIQFLCPVSLLSFVTICHRIGFRCQHTGPSQIFLNQRSAFCLKRHMFQRHLLRVRMLQKNFSAADTAGIGVFVIEPCFHTEFLRRFTCIFHQIHPFSGKIGNGQSLSGADERASNSLIRHFLQLSADFLP